MVITSLCNFSFAIRVSEQVTPIFVPPVEMPAPCHVRLGGPTLKLCESFAVCGTRLSLPYILRSTFVLPTGEEQAKYQSANTAIRLVLMRRRHSHQKMRPRFSRRVWNCEHVRFVRWMARTMGLNSGAYDRVVARCRYGQLLISISNTAVGPLAGDQPRNFHRSATKT